MEQNTTDKTELITQERIRELLASGTSLYDRKELCSLILLALVANESIFLYGPPGTAKSMAAHWAANLLATDKYFSCLLNQYTQPDELFGPVSIQMLEHGAYTRLTAGYLPEAEICFLDEIWKAGPAILNTLLTITNERIFKNGNAVCPVPLKLLLSASNEFPAEDSGLGALYDRFLIRVAVEPISNKTDFVAMLKGKSKDVLFAPLTAQELSRWQNLAKNAEVPKSITDFLYSLRLQTEKSNLYISDRRWKKALGLMKASAVLNGRAEVTLSDAAVLTHCLWNKLEERATITELIASRLENANADTLQQLSALATAVEKEAQKDSKSESGANKQLAWIEQTEKQLSEITETCAAKLGINGDNLFASAALEKALKNALKDKALNTRKVLEKIRERAMFTKDLIASGITAAEIAGVKREFSFAGKIQAMQRVLEPHIMKAVAQKSENGMSIDELQQKYIAVFSPLFSAGEKSGVAETVQKMLQDCLKYTHTRENNRRVWEKGADRIIRAYARFHPKAASDTLFGDGGQLED